MDDIIFNYDIFYNWYYSKYTFEDIFGPSVINNRMVRYFSFANGNRDMIDGKDFIYLSNKYGIDLQQLNKNFTTRPYNRLNRMFVSINNSNKRIYFVFPREDINVNSEGQRRIWGDHYTFLKDGNQIIFHRSDVSPNLNNTLNGKNDHTFCIFNDGIVISFNNGKYNIENIICKDRYSNLFNPINSIFTKTIELEILRDIITYPWDYRINRYATTIRMPPPVPPSSPVGGNILHFYNGKKYKVRIGKQGGRYIIVNNKKKYIKNQASNNNAIDVIAIKDPIKPKIWWYTISWISKDGIFHKINRSSEELNCLSLDNYIKILL